MLHTASKIFFFYIKKLSFQQLLTIAFHILIVADTSRPVGGSVHMNVHSICPCASAAMQDVQLIALACCESSLSSPKALGLASLRTYSIGKPNNIRHHRIVEAENVFLFEG